MDSPLPGSAGLITSHPRLVKYQPDTPRRALQGAWLPLLPSVFNRPIPGAVQSYHLAVLGNWAGDPDLIPRCGVTARATPLSQI